MVELLFPLNDQPNGQMSSRLEESGPIGAENGADLMVVAIFMVVLSLTK